ncbi:UDP-glucose 4-epimerase GalE [Spirochaetota bacterium]
MKSDDYILVVGGAGYIGSHINKELFKKGYNTIVFDNLVYGHKELVKWGNFVQGDLKNLDQIKKVFDSYSISSVMHFAAYAYVGESVKNPEKYYTNNVVNTLNLLNLMNACNIKNFIFSSSCATYGTPEKIPIPEDHPQNPINPYGRGKLMVEQILDDYSRAYNMKYVSLRYFNAAGADPDIETGEWHDPETHLIPLILDTAIGKRDSISVFGTDYNTKDGTCIRDYIHVTDLAQAHILALEHLTGGGNSEIFNLGNGNGHSVMEVIETAKKITGKQIDVINTERREGDPPELIGSSMKAKTMLGWKPIHDSLETIIETAWQWHRKLY